MNNRSRVKNGSFIQKRNDTKIGTIEKMYGVDLGMCSDAKLGTVLKKMGNSSLSKLLKMADPTEIKSRK